MSDNCYELAKQTFERIMKLENPTQEQLEQLKIATDFIESQRASDRAYARSTHPADLCL